MESTNNQTVNGEAPPPINFYNDHDNIDKWGECWNLLNKNKDFQQSNLAPMKEYVDKKYYSNIMLIGGTGAGKSSTINTLGGKMLAKVSNSKT